MRCRIRPAVSALLVQIGCRMASTSAVSMSSTRRSPRTGRAYSLRLSRHWVACRVLDHVSARSSMTVSAASANVGMAGSTTRRTGPRAFRWSAGSSPRRIVLRSSSACSRASLSETAGYAPSPRFRRLPSTVSRSTQLLRPDGFTLSIRPSPSVCKPGLAFFTWSVES